MSKGSPAKELGFKVGSTIHRAVLGASGGRVGAKTFGMPTVQLHTVGRVSGKARTAVLAAPVRDGDTVVLVASRGGDDRDPDWFKNLVAHPDAEIALGDRRWPVRARVATDDERAQLWPKIVGAYKGYAGYQKKTSRTIPVVICEPR